MSMSWRQPGDGAPITTSPPRVGPVQYVVGSLASLVLCLIGPALFSTLLFVDDHRWSIAAGGVVLTVLFGLLGLATWRSTKLCRRDTKLLDAKGIPASAEILTIETKAWGEQDGVQLGLRVSGPGFESFDTTFEWKRDDDYQVGGRLAVLVEPSAGLYEVRI